MKIEPIKFKNQIYHDWKDYFIKKFSENDIFYVEEFDTENKHYESYKITLKDKTSETEIIFQIYKNDIPYIELFDVVFNNPNSPKFAEDNLKNTCGFDREDSEFNLNNLIDIEKLLDVPLKYGWKEKTTWFNGKELNTDVIWEEDGKTYEIPVKQNYLDKYGCLTFPIVPFAILWNSQKLKLFPKKVEIKIVAIEPMLK